MVHSLHPRGILGVKFYEKRVIEPQYVFKLEFLELFDECKESEKQKIEDEASNWLNRQANSGDIIIEPSFSYEYVLYKDEYLTITDYSNDNNQRYYRLEIPEEGFTHDKMAFIDLIEPITDPVYRDKITNAIFHK